MREKENTNRENREEGTGVGLYLHLPFCVRKCPYCNFFSLAAPSPGEIEAYLAALEREMDAAAPAVAGTLFTTLYLGGGTPTFLPASSLAALITKARARFAFTGEVEVTVEANPGTVESGKLAALAEAGVNRLSLGVQATRDSLLAGLGRIHTWEAARQAFQLARAAGFDNINIDLMFGIPGQTLADWEESLNLILALAPEHLALYALEVEAGTPFGAQAARGELPLPGEDFEAEAYQLACRRLVAAGYEHYEISNFARPGRRSRHNQLYWQARPYLGLGAGAHSYWGGWRFWNITKVAAYTARLQAWGNRPLWRQAQVGAAVQARAGAIAGGEEISPRLAQAEFMFLGLRQVRDGVRSADFQCRFGVELEEVYGREIRRLCSQGLLVREGERLRLSPRGLLYANRVFAEFLA